MSYRQYIANLKAQQKFSEKLGFSIDAFPRPFTLHVIHLMPKSKHVKHFSACNCITHCDSLIMKMCEFILQDI